MYLREYSPRVLPREFIKNAMKLIPNSGHIVDQNLKLILGLVWIIILHYSIQIDTFPPETTEKCFTPKERLLSWVTDKIELPVENFTTHWNDGRAVGSLVDSFAPGLCPNWRYWDGKKRLENVTEAMETAETWLSVPMLITPDEIINPRVDEKSVMTYIAQFSGAEVKEGAPLKRPEPPFQAKIRNPGCGKK
ncbi:filamin-A-like [Octopus sinensis]|uniref:Filamin-A-like n=1 Tax=Octopus sinensis TaxID=2607531 RepID=A0A6P7U9B2_9MOLL|nr:filamin-A-like [Octopus sinensis]